MKRQTGIWIDSSKAIIVALDGETEKITEIDSEVENSVHHNDEGNKGTFSGVHHGNSDKKFENRKEQELDYFIKSVLSYVKKSDELIVFGPAQTKTKLEQKLMKDHLIEPGKLKAVETADKMTLNQIVEKVRRFYNPYEYKEPKPKS
ncbi:hypothetical protein DR871_004855 [Flavobacterium petrolei]|uniref:Host attachment protein n=1 Tax=Flavobacterium petrolei TaxID=2259594 RepID=A0A482TKT9_9FLAO|nr:MULTISPECIES: hypothetical protein [Flavobacterium]MDD2673718.1 hypothetical protein [Flavobacterium sp.]QIH39072.1 hypothetical protein G7A72_09750 [Flavobacterium sp. Sr18]RYJ53385.1 hypothetical protein DR871_004855 [Flavobacterium petrolei]